MKRPVVLIVVLVVLIGIYWITNSKKAVVATNRPFVALDSVKINSLRIESGGETVVIAKQGDKWNLTQPVAYPAAQKMVGMTLGKFREMIKLSMISDKAERQGEFQVTAQDGAKVTVNEGGKSTTFFVGKSSSSGGTSYVRMDGSNEIWEVGGVQSPNFKRKARDWRDKTITELNAGDFKRFSFQYPGESFTLTLEDTTWKVDAGKIKYDAEKDLVGRLTNLLTRLSTIDFADSLDPNFFDHPAGHVTADLADGSKLDLRLVPKDAEATQYYVRKQDAASDFVLYKSTADVIMKHPGDFKTQPENPKKETKKAGKKK